MATLSKKDFEEITSGPPVYHLLAVFDKLKGSHFTHPSWKGLAGVAGSSEPGIPVVVKYLDSPVQMDIELACGLVSQILMLPVPKPALVYAGCEFLPDAPAKIVDGCLLFGSAYQPDTYVTNQTMPSEDAAQDVYNKVCATEVGALGAAWDELVANPDRHPYNFLFDGRKWWLFDHNKALEPLNRILEKVYLNDAGWIQSEIMLHAAKVNLLFNEMIKRDKSVENINQCAELMAKKSKEIKVLSDKMNSWKTEDPMLNQSLRMASAIVAIIGSRLNPLAELLQRRSGTTTGYSLWTPASS